jgi:hypothetical protein
MSVSFVARPATAEEAKRFDQLHPVELSRLKIVREGKNFEALAGKTKADFDGDGSLDRFVCIDTPEKTGGRKLGCTIKDLGKIGWFVKMIVYDPHRDQPIRELRVGDINKDGRIDFAVRLHDGAIRVYENKPDGK